MSYETNGKSEKSLDDILNAARKQRKVKAVTSAALGPFNFAATKISGFVARANDDIPAISDEEFIKALALKVLQEQNLYPHSAFKQRIKPLMKVKHPHWVNEALQK